MAIHLSMGHNILAIQWLYLNNYKIIKLDCVCLSYSA